MTTTDTLNTLAAILQQAWLHDNFTPTAHRDRYALIHAQNALLWAQPHHHLAGMAGIRFAVVRKALRQSMQMRRHFVVDKWAE